MTITIHNQHALSGAEIEQLRTLVDAAVLCLVDDLVHDQRDFAIRNLHEIERFLHAVANDAPRPSLGLVVYGRVSVERVGETRIKE